MKIALIGYGKMGKALETAAKERNHQICAIIPHITPDNAWQDSGFNQADVCIDFTHPSCAVHNIEKLAACGKQLIIGTTGWYDDIHNVKAAVAAANIGLLYAPNFSLGVQLFLRIVNAAAKIIAPFDQYDAAAYELHHRKKADSPSGTAQALLNEVLANFTQKKTALHGTSDGLIAPEQMQLASLRLGCMPGTHTLLFDSPEDTITISHQARNREGFANGAIFAAEWLQDKKGVFTLEQLMNEILQRAI